MAKTVTKYTCQSCGASFARWMGKCEQCGAWNSLAEEVVSLPSKGLGRSSATASALKPTGIEVVSVAKLPRLGTGIGEVDQVLGGGIVPGSVILLSGDPGIGKSTLVLQIAAALARGERVLY